MSDLTSKTVEELLQLADEESSEVGCTWLEVCSELARRLEEAQKQIVAQQSVLHEYLFLHASECEKECGCSICHKARRYYENSAAHDAETAAKALEEVSVDIASLAERPYDGSPEFEVLLHIEAIIRRKATEYLARAGRKE